MFRYPDKPIRATPAVLPSLAEGDWLVQFKYDGWRDLVRWDGTRATHTSRHNQPLPVGPEIIAETAAMLRGLPPMLLDAEWTGRRAGLRERLYLFDMLEHDGAWLGAVGAEDRYRRLRKTIPERVHLVTIADGWFEGYAEMFEESKTDERYEGIVLKRCDGRFVGSVRESIENPAMLKIKWRAGESGTTKVA